MPQSKILSLFLSFCLILEQSVFAQTIDLSHYFVRNPAQTIPQSDKFRPLHLRYISYDNQANDFKILLDKGDFFNQKTGKPKNEKTLELEKTTQELMKYFFIGLSLPNEKFWVNLRPDSPDNILDPDLEKTDIGRIFLEADVQLKKDTSGMTSPQTKEGREYWDKLYKKAGELFGTENITIPTITRPWIVPNEIIIREAPDNAYIYKATLKVMLEEDYLTGSGGSRTATTPDQYAFSDPRLKELNEYSTQLIKEAIIPKLTYAVNTAKRYAPLRQVYYSLILAQWFKGRFSKSGSLPERTVPDIINLIDSGNLANLASSQPYDKQAYFRQYQKSFKDGEYNLQELVDTPMGQSIRRYISGGVIMASSALKPEFIRTDRKELAVSNILISPEDERGKHAASPVSLAGRILLTVTSDIHLNEGIHTYMFKLTNMLASRHKNLTQIILYNDTLNKDQGEEERLIGESKIVFVPFREDSLEEKMQSVKEKYGHIDIMFTPVPWYPEGIAAGKFSQKYSIPFGVYVMWGDGFSGAWKRLPELKGSEEMRRKEEALRKSLTINPNTFILTMSKAGQNEIQEVADMQSDVVGPMIATDIFKPFLVGGQEKEDLRKTLGIKNSDTVLLFPNDFHYRKSPDELVAAILYYRNKRYKNWFVRFFASTKIGSRIIGNYGIKNIKVVFIGGILDAQLFEETKREIKKHGLEDAFIFYGKVSQEKLRAWYAISDVVMLPSKEEGFGLVVAEASLMAVPTIAYDIPGVNEVIVHNKTGLLVPWDSSPKIRIGRLAGAIGELINNPPKRKAMGVKGRERIIEEFDPGKLILKHEEEYSKAIQGHGNITYSHMSNNQHAANSAADMVNSTEFPNYTPKIRTVVNDTVNKMIAEGMSIIRVSFDPDCSIGRELAMPYSDIDGLTVIHDIKDGRRLVLAKDMLYAALRNNLIGVNPAEVRWFSKDEIAALKGKKYMSFGEITKWGRIKLSITYFKPLYSMFPEDSMFSSFSSESIPGKIEFSEKPKHSVREKLFKEWEGLDAVMKDAIKQIHMRIGANMGSIVKVNLTRSIFEGLLEKQFVTLSESGYYVAEWLGTNGQFEAVIQNASSALVVKNAEGMSDMGGIAFNALPIQTESVASSALGVLPGGRAFKGDLTEEWGKIQSVFNVGIRPSMQRLSEYTAAAAVGPLAGERIDQVRVMLADILRRDEESQKLAPAEESCKQLLRALEAG